MREALLNSGLKGKETTIYLALLKHKSQTASFLAKKTRINRTTTYLELDNLINKGLASYHIKDGKKYFQAANPKVILESLEEKKKNVKDILPQLLSMHSTNEPISTEVFEEKEGIKTFYQDILSSCKEFYALGATGKAAEILRYHYPHIVKQFNKANIKELAIANLSAKKMMESHPEGLITVKYLPKGKESEVTTIIYADKVGIQSLGKDRLYVVLIQDKALNMTYRRYFELLWELL